MAKGVKRVQLVGLPDNIRWMAHVAAGQNPGWIYFLVADQLELVKIGACNRYRGHEFALDERIREVKLGAAIVNFTRKFAMFASVLGLTETELFAHFREYRIDTSEWFVLCDDLKEFVECIARCDAEIIAGQHPSEHPWRLLDNAPRPPSKHFVRLCSEFK